MTVALRIRTRLPCKKLWEGEGGRAGGRVLLLAVLPNHCTAPSVCSPGKQVWCLPPRKDGNSTSRKIHFARLDYDKRASIFVHSTFERPTIRHIKTCTTELPVQVTRVPPGVFQELRNVCLSAVLVCVEVSFGALLRVFPRLVFSGMCGAVAVVNKPCGLVNLTPWWHVLARP